MDYVEGSGSEMVLMLLILLMVTVCIVGGRVRNCSEEDGAALGDTS